MDNDRVFSHIINRNKRCARLEYPAILQRHPCLFLLVASAIGSGVRRRHHRGIRSWPLDRRPSLRRSLHCPFTTTAGCNASGLNSFTRLGNARCRERVVEVHRSNNHNRWTHNLLLHGDILVIDILSRLYLESARRFTAQKHDRLRTRWVNSGVNTRKRSRPWPCELGRNHVAIILHRNAAGW